MFSWHKTLTVIGCAVTLWIWSNPAMAQSRHFDRGSLIIPMDIDYQDEGMLQAYGLVYQLLFHDVTVYWIIRSDKVFGEPDFMASARDLESNQDIQDHGYRGGPFVIDSADAARAEDIVSDWQQDHVTTVHRATDAFDAEVSRVLTVAPTIAVFADGNEDIAFGYLNAAHIPDSLGQAWPDRKDNSREYPGWPDVLSVDEVRGPDPDNVSDGSLFDDQGLPRYCQLMTMHWGVNERDDAAIAEIRAFLQFPTHFFAECQAVNAVENSVNGHFLTPNGYIMDDRPDNVEFLNPFLPFAQLDGPFETIGGSEPSYSLPDGDEYYDQGVVMITERDSGIGHRDIWMTGYIDGICDIVTVKGRKDGECQADVGKVSYLGGHRYSTATPISEHPDSQGTRLFLNALFEADCVTTVGQPAMAITLDGPAWTPEPQVDYHVTVINSGAGVAHEGILTLTLPQDVTMVSSSLQATQDGTSISWDMGNIAPHSSTQIDVTIELPGDGTYDFVAHLDFLMGQNARSVDSNEVSTRLGGPPPKDAGTGNTDAATSDGGNGTDSGSGPDSGCGCRTQGSPLPPSLPLLVVMVLALWYGRRRGKSRS